MATYNDKQSFRGWLYTVTLNTIRSYASELRRGELQCFNGFEQLLVGSDEFAEDVAERDVLEVAKERTRVLCRGREWEVFNLHALEHITYDELEEKTGLERTVLMNYVSTVKKRLTTEMAKLNEGKDEAERR